MILSHLEGCAVSHRSIREQPDSNPSIPNAGFVEAAAANALFGFVILTGSWRMRFP